MKNKSVFEKINEILSYETEPPKTFYQLNSKIKYISNCSFDQYQIKIFRFEPKICP